MLKFLWLLWRIGVPLLGLGAEGICIAGIVGVWKGGVDATQNLFLTSLIVAAMVLIALIVLVIEGMFHMVYRVALPAFMGVLAFSLLFLLIVSLHDVSQSDIVGSELFGSMKFYAAMLSIAVWAVAEALWMALLFIIQGLPQASLWSLIVGGCLLGLALVVTFFYWIVLMLIYFFKHYYQIFFIVFGSAMGVLYLTFLVIYCVVKRKTLARIFNDNLDKHWRKAV